MSWEKCAVSWSIRNIRESSSRIAEIELHSAVILSTNEDIHLPFCSQKHSISHCSFHMPLWLLSGCISLHYCICWLQPLANANLHHVWTLVTNRNDPNHHQICTSFLHFLSKSQFQNIINVLEPLLICIQLFYILVIMPIHCISCISHNTEPQVPDILQLAIQDLYTLMRVFTANWDLSQILIQDLRGCSYGRILLSC